MQIKPSEGIEQIIIGDDLASQSIKRRKEKG